MLRGPRAYDSGSANSMKNGTTKRGWAAKPPSDRNASPTPGRPKDTIRAWLSTLASSAQRNGRNIHAPGDFLTSPHTVIATRPPGRSTRRTSASASRVVPQMPRKLVATSKHASSQGRSLMSPTRMSLPGFLSRAISTSRTDASIPAHSAPRIRASSNARPDPQATSRTRSSGPSPSRECTNTYSRQLLGSASVAKSAALRPQPSSAIVQLTGRPLSAKPHGSGQDLDATGLARGCWHVEDRPSRLRRLILAGGTYDGEAGGQGGDPDPGPASACLRELHVGRARRRARRRGPRHLRARAHAGAVRARGPTAPTSRAVPRLLGAVGHLHRPVLAAVRLDRSRHGDLGSGGRVPALWIHPSAAVRQGSGARARASAGGDDRGAPDRGERLLPVVRHPTGARTSGPGRSRPAPERGVHEARHAEAVAPRRLPPRATGVLRGRCP